MEGLSHERPRRFGARIWLAMVAVNRWRQPTPLAAMTYGGLGSVIVPALEAALVVFVVYFAVVGLAVGASIPVIGSDSGFALAIAKAAVNGNHEWVDILAPPVQVAIYAPLIAIGRPEFATAVPALFGGLLVVLVFIAAWRITGMPSIVARSGDTEAMPVALLEAMAAGRPVVATSVGGIPEVVIPGRTGLLIEPESPNALAAAVAQLLESPDRAERMGELARRWVRRRSDRGSVTAGYGNLLTKAMNSGSGSA